MYQIGDLVWMGSYESMPVRETCPVCYGKKSLILILGNDEQLQIDCEYCAQGVLRVPSGWVEERYQFEPLVKRVRITGVELRESGDEPVRYSCHDGKYTNSSYGQNLFETEEAALLHAYEIVKRRLTAQEEELKQKTKINYSYAWNVGYHMRELKAAERNVAYHQNKIRYLSEKVRKTEK
jgi:hypothetical protein